MREGPCVCAGICCAHIELGNFVVYHCSESLQTNANQYELKKKSISQTTVLLLLQLQSSLNEVFARPTERAHRPPTGTKPKKTERNNIKVENNIIFSMCTRARVR